MQIMHFVPLKQYALIMIMWVLLHGVFRHCGFQTVGILHHDMGIIMGIIMGIAFWVFVQ